MKYMKIEETHWVAVVTAKLFSGGIITALVGILLFLNQIEYFEVVLSVALILMLFFYIIQFIFPKIEKEQPDWSLVYPELAGMDVNDSEKI